MKPDAFTPAYQAHLLTFSKIVTDSLAFLVHFSKNTRYLIETFER